jgi:hypothetical protein
MSVKQLFTSYFARSGKHPNAVAISAKAPPFYNGPFYSKLAPSWDLLRAYKSGKVDERGYTEWYLRLLAERKLTPQQAAEELEEGSVLLCYEGPGKFCHRHIAAEWLEAGGSVKVTELVLSPSPQEEPTETVDEFFEF